MTGPAEFTQTGRAQAILAGSAAQLRPLARRVHFLAGILVAPFVLLLCVTGLVYVCSPQIHDDLYGNQLFVDEVGTGGPRPVAGQVAAALAAHPEAELRSVVPPPEPDRTTRVNLAVPGPTEPGEVRTVFVDPYTDRISGELTTVDGRMPANVWLRDLHADLHLGPVGRLYSEVAASWLPVIVVSGLVQWIAKQGRRRRGLRELLTPLPRGKGEQARMRAVHGPLGIWLTVGLLVMSGTGLAMSRFAGWGLPAVRAPELATAQVVAPGNVGPIGVDRVLEVARAEGLGGELVVAAPTAPDRPFTVTETSPGLPIQKDGIAVDPYTGQVTERIGWDDYPFLAQLRELGVQAHTGSLFGPANQIVLALLVITTIVLVLIGYRMWWRRNPYRQEARLPPAPPPALRRLPASVAVPVVLAVVVLGWLLPVFGISLLAFVAADLVVGAVRQPQGRLRRTGIAGALLAAGTGLGGVVLADAPAPVARVDAIGTLPPGPGQAPPEPPRPIADPAAPADAPGTGVVPPPRRGAGAGPPADSAPPPAGGSAGADADARPTGDDAAGDGASRDPDSHGSDDPGPSAGPADARGVPKEPEDDAPAPEPPPEQDANDDPADRVAELAEPVTSYLIDAVDRVTDGLLGR
jgi:uncharacterized iron-regulated membrane protein